MDFIDENGFMILNDSLPTFHFSKSINGTAPDITLFKSEDNITITNWKREHPIGKCHHDVLTYSINYSDIVFPFRP